VGDRFMVADLSEPGLVSPGLHDPEPPEELPGYHRAVGPEIHLSPDQDRAERVTTRLPADRCGWSIPYGPELRGELPRPGHAAGHFQPTMKSVARRNTPAGAGS
jgi:hypothetical protein